MEKIILDTNFVMAIAKFRIDLSYELRRICDFPYKLYILDKSLKELQAIINTGNNKDSKLARLGIALTKNKAAILKSGFYKDDVDSTLAKLSEKGYVIATQDKELKRRIKGKIMVIKQKKYLSFQKK